MNSHSFSGNCEFRGTGNVSGQLFVHISDAKSSLLPWLSFKYFLSQRRPQHVTFYHGGLHHQRLSKKNVYSTSWCSDTALSSSVFNFFISKWRKMLHFEICSPDGWFHVTRSSYAVSPTFIQAPCMVPPSCRQKKSTQTSSPIDENSLGVEPIDFSNDFVTGRTASNVSAAL